MANVDEQPKSPRRATEADRRIGARISVLRKAKGISGTATAEAIGVSFQQFQKYERGLNRLSAARLQTIASLLGMPLATFLHEDHATEASDGLLELVSVKGAVDLLRVYAASRPSAVQM